MFTRTLGRSGIRVSAVGLGTARIGGLGWQEDDREVLTRDGRSFVQGALGWIWARSPRAIPVPGFRTIEHVEEDAQAMRFGPLDEAQMGEVQRLWGR